MRAVFKTADFKQLSNEALEACESIGVKPESLQVKQIESFVQSPTEPKELAQVRLDHYTNKRKRKFTRKILFCFREHYPNF